MLIVSKFYIGLFILVNYCVLSYQQDDVSTCGENSNIGGEEQYYCSKIEKIDEDLQLKTDTYGETICNKRTFESDSFVCVCDGQHCDIFPTDVTDSVPSGKFKVITSSRDKDRFQVREGSMTNDANGETLIEINYSNTFQTIIGFGGAFTDATGIVMQSLTEEGQNNLIRSYFGPDGIEYNIGRIPIGGTDFSTRPYSYDDIEDDVELKYFALVDEDFKFKIPLIESALNMSKKDIRLFASLWSPPAWMKVNNKINGKGGLREEMVDPFSEYIIKFIRAYEEQNIHLWGLTTVNEPLAGFMEHSWNACAFSAEDTRDWIKNSLGPILEREKLLGLKIMVYEHGREALPNYPATSLEDPEASKYIDGISVHWYNDRQMGPEVMIKTHEMFPDKFLIYTEACEGFDSDKNNKVILGSWQRAENYASNIIENLNNYVSGWVDWNLALNMEGGPNWSKNFVDSPIIVNEDEKEFYKQPMFYAMGHFSKFIQEGAKRLELRLEQQDIDIEATAVVNPDDSYTVIILNKAMTEKLVSLKTTTDLKINLSLAPKSLNTVIYSS